jgi:amphi-Trp domain-containing protein
MAMTKFKKTETLSREEVARRLLQLSQAIGSGAELELEPGGERVDLDVPEIVTLELEVEIGVGEVEVEVELSWSRPSAPIEPATDSPGWPA